MFEASGSLWQDALVLRDRETGSLWSQVLGECISGPLEGATLTLYPVFYTTYREFKNQYPKGLLLRKPSKGKAGSYYESYFADQSKLGIFGRINNFKRLGAKEVVFGLRLHGKDVAITKVFLKEYRYKIIENSHEAVLVYFNPKTNTVMAYSLTSLDYQSTNDITVSDSTITLPGKNQSWNLKDGQSNIAGLPHLERVPVTTAFWFAWVSFFPETDLIR